MERTHATRISTEPLSLRSLFAPTRRLKAGAPTAMRVGDNLQVVDGTLVQKATSIKEKTGYGGKKYAKVVHELTFSATSKQGRETLIAASSANRVVGVQLYFEGSHATWRKSGRSNIHIEATGNIRGRIERVVCPICKHGVSVNSVHDMKDMVCQPVQYVEAEPHSQSVFNVDVALRAGAVVQFGKTVWGAVTMSGGGKSTVSITKGSAPKGRAVMEIYEEHACPGAREFQETVNAKVHFIVHEYILQQTPHVTTQKKVYVYPRYIQYMSKGTWMSGKKRVGSKRQRPVHFTMEAEERNKVGRGIGVNDVKMRSLLRPDIKFDIFGRVAVAQKFWHAMPIELYHEYFSYTALTPKIKGPVKYGPLGDSDAWKNTAQIEAFAKWYNAKEPAMVPSMVDAGEGGVYPAAMLYPSHDSARDTIVAAQGRRQQAASKDAEKRRRRKAKSFVLNNIGRCEQLFSLPLHPSSMEDTLQRLHKYMQRVEQLSLSDNPLFSSVPTSAKEQARVEFGATNTQVQAYKHLLQPRNWKYIMLGSTQALSVDQHPRITRFALQHKKDIAERSKMRTSKRHAARALFEMKRLCKPLEYFPETDVAVWGKRTPEEWEKYLPKAAFRDRVHNMLRARLVPFPKCWAQVPRGSKKRPFRDEKALVEHSTSIRGKQLRQFRTGTYMGYYLDHMGSVKHMDASEWKRKATPEYFAAKEKQNDEKEKAKATKKLKVAKTQQKRQQAARAKQMQQVDKKFVTELKQIQREAAGSCKKFKIPKPDRLRCKKQMHAAELTSVEEAIEQGMLTQDFRGVLEHDMREAKEDIADTFRVYTHIVELNARDDRLRKVKKQKRKECSVKGLPMAERKTCKEEVDAAQSTKDIVEVVGRYKRKARDHQLLVWAKKVYKPKTQKALRRRKTAPHKQSQRRSKEEVEAMRETKKRKQAEKEQKKKEWGTLWKSLVSKGWVVDEKERKGGSTAGTKDRYWVAPSQGANGKRRRFRSTIEVLNHVRSLAAGGPTYIIHTEEEQRAIDNPLDFSDSAVTVRKRVHARSSFSSSGGVHSPYRTSGSDSSDDGYNDEESDYSSSGEEDEESVAKCVLGKDEYENRKLFPYQHALKFLVDATSPINKMLVAWRTGAGKTLGIIQVLETHRFDYRPKVLIFPTKTLEENFYRELLKTKNFYRTHVVKLLKFEVAEKTNAKGHQTSRKCEILQHILSGQIGADEIKEARDILEMQQNSWRHGGAKPDPVRTKPNPKSVLKILRRIASRRMHAQALYSTKKSGLSDEGTSLFQKVDDALNATNPVDKLNDILPVKEGKKCACAAMQKYIEALAESLSTYSRFGDYLYYLQQNMWPDVLLMRAPLIIMNYTRAGGSQSVVAGGSGSYPGTFSWANSRVDAVVRDDKHETSNGVVCKDIPSQPDWYEFVYLNDTKDHNYEMRFRDNPYSSTITIMDEFHNIMPKYAKRYVDKLERISDLLKNAQNNVVVGMTATPIVNDTSDSEHLMDVLGKTAMVSYFNDLHPVLYPCLTNDPGTTSCPESDSTMATMFGRDILVKSTDKYVFKSNGSGAGVYTSAFQFYKQKMLSMFGNKVMYDEIMSSPTALLRDNQSGKVPEGAENVRRYGRVQSAKIMLGTKEYRWVKAPKKKKVKKPAAKKFAASATVWLRERGAKSAKEFTDKELVQATVELRTDKLQRRCQLYCNISKTNWYNSEKFFESFDWKLAYPKLKAVAEYILRAPHRVLVLVHQSCGFKAVRATLQHMVKEDPDKYTPPCPDPYILEYKKGVLPKNFNPMIQPDLCQGSTRLQLKDLIYYEEDDGEDFELDSDPSGESDEELLRGGNTPHASPDRSDAYNPEDDAGVLEADALLDQHNGNAVDADALKLAAVEATKYGAAMTAKRRKVKLSDEQKTKRDDSTQRNNFNMGAVFKTGWKDKKFKSVTMSRAGGIRTLKEDKVARKKEEEKQNELRRSSRRKKTEASYKDPLSRVTMSVAKKGDTIVFEIKDPAYAKDNHIVVQLTYDIVRVEDPEPVQCFSAIYEKECSIAKDNFNEKLYKNGKPFGVKMIVANSAEFGEGVSFKGVREIILFNPALRWSEHKQWVGRALRSCDQPNKPVTITTFVTKGAHGMKTADEHAWDKLKLNGQTLETALSALREKSVEWDKTNKRLLYETTL